MQIELEEEQQIRTETKVIFGIRRHNQADRSISVANRLYLTARTVNKTPIGITNTPEIYPLYINGDNKIIKFRQSELEKLGFTIIIQ